MYKKSIPQAVFDSQDSTMKMKGTFTIVIVLVFVAGFSNSSATGTTITADIVSSAYDELKSFMKANGKYMGRMVRLSKYNYNKTATKKYKSEYTLQFSMTALVMPAMVALIPAKTPIRV